MNTISNIAVHVLLGVLLTAFMTTAILDVATLYSITFITELGFVQLFGTLMIVRLISLKKSDIVESIRGDDDIGGWYHIITAIFILIFWGLSYVSFWLITLN